MPASAPRTALTGWPTLLGEGAAFVLGLPSGFSLYERLQHATQIRLATAFGHYAGWKHIKSAIETSNASASLLTGSEFFQTEPALLKSWLRLMQSTASRITAKLAADDPFFHPKVLIVTSGAGADFAIVGSGNLSNGGLQSNVECSVYVQDCGAIGKLTTWFDSHFDCGVKLNRAVIEKYERKYKQNRKRRNELETDQRLVAKDLGRLGRAEMERWDQAVNTAVEYFRTPEFAKAYQARQSAAPRILRVLDSPDFDFNRKNLDEFFEIGQLGQLDARWKDKVFRKARLLKEALRALLADPETTLREVLEKSGKYYVPGVRLNFISKVLAAHEPARWPVFNRRVDVALRNFKYEPARGGGVTGKYLAYRDLMKTFVEACKDKGSKTVDAFALDAFFFDQSVRLEKVLNRSI